MNEIKSKASTMKGLKFTAAEKEGEKVRVSIKDADGVLKVRKWNYRLKRWGRWSLLSL